MCFPKVLCGVGSPVTVLVGVGRASRFKGRLRRRSIGIGIYLINGSPRRSLGNSNGILNKSFSTEGTKERNSCPILHRAFTPSPVKAVAEHTARYAPSTKPQLQLRLIIGAVF
ncbi:unnamed protein product [Cochlearia groenlandica]